MQPSLRRRVLIVDDEENQRSAVSEMVAGWGFSTVAFRVNCPLTWLETWSRQRAGEASLGSGFIDHYIEGVVYPERYTGLIQFLAGTVVVVSWTGALILYLRRRKHRTQARSETS